MMKLGLIVLCICVRLSDLTDMGHDKLQDKIV